MPAMATGTCAGLLVAGMMMPDKSIGIKDTIRWMLRVLFHK